MVEHHSTKRHWLLKNIKIRYFLLGLHEAAAVDELGPEAHQSGSQALEVLPQPGGHRHAAEGRSGDGKVRIFFFLLN
jgi:hypothetical protein